MAAENQKRTDAQRRAEDALQKAESANGRDDAFRKAYRSYVDSLAPTIVMNGLGQALATEISAAGGMQEESIENKDKQAHLLLYRNVEKWLLKAVPGLVGDDLGKPDAARLLKALSKRDEGVYLQAQAEALAWLEWHKKFCRAFMPRGEQS